MLRARHLVFPDADELKRALTAFEKGRGDFSDYVLWALAVAGGADAVATFDKRLWAEPGFERPSGP